MQKWTFLIFGLLFAVVFAAGADAAFVLYKRANPVGGDALLAGDSRAFADDAVAAIVGHWDERQLLARATPRLARSLPPTRLRWIFGGLAHQLGHMTGVLGATGNPCQFVSDTPMSGTPPAYFFVIHPEFGEHIATVEMTIVQMNGRWMIDFFRVTPNAVRGFARAI